MKRILILIILIGTLMVVGWSMWPSKAEVAPVLVSQIIPPTQEAPDVRTIAAVTLKGVKAQNKIVVMESNYVAVVESDETRLGIFHSRKTLVLPGTFRYQVDLNGMTDRDLRWDSRANVLHVRIPKVAIDGPDVDLTKAKHYADGMLTSFSSVSEALDDRNTKVAREQLIRQAGDARVMQQARNSAERAIEQTFSMPLRAAGVTATVVVEMI